MPDGLVGQVESVRDAMTERIDTYGPLMDTYVEVSARLPAILGWDEPRRYLVLTQDPAELRPTGRFMGKHGIIAFDRGRITERRFEDVSPLDFPWDYPRIEPPGAGGLPAGAEAAVAVRGRQLVARLPDQRPGRLRLYTNESGDAAIDGVLGITTYTIDQLLKVTGPVTVPDYDVTIASGETTLKVLQIDAGRSRGRGPEGLSGGVRGRAARLAPRPAAPEVGQRPRGSCLVRPGSPAGGMVQQCGGPGTRCPERLRRGRAAEPGDYLYPVDANVAPPTKLNMLTTRTLQLDVQIDDVGNARNTLDVTWDNKVEAPEWEPYRAMVNTGGRILGTYFRLLVPERSRVEAVSGGTLSPVTNPAVVEDEAGPNGDRHLPEGSAGGDEAPLHVDEPLRSRRDQRDLPGSPSRPSLGRSQVPFRSRSAFPTTS